jgi:hypothetical protein
MLLFGLLVSGASSLLMGFVDDLNVFYALAGFVGLLSNAGYLGINYCDRRARTSDAEDVPVAS